MAKATHPPRVRAFWTFQSPSPIKGHIGREEATRLLQGPDQQRIFISFMMSILQELVETGAIDPKGKSDQQLSVELRYYIKRTTKSAGVQFAYSYSDQLLSQARRYADDRNGHLAILFYATWIEHWINGVIYTRGKVMHLVEDELLMLIRDTSLRTKLSVLPRLLGLPGLKPSHISVVLRASELRNAFVHYKQVPKSDLKLDEGKPTTTDFERTEKSVRYLQGYYRSHVSRLSRERIQKIVLMWAGPALQK